MSGLGRYLMEVRRVADELEELMVGPLRKAAFSVLNRVGREGLLNMDKDALEKAIRLLSQTPSQRDKTLARLDDEDAATLLLRARYLGLCSANAFDLADQFLYVPGMGYRKAAEHGVRQVLRHRLTPDMEDVLRGWEGPGSEYDGDDDYDSRYGWDG